MSRGKRFESARRLTVLCALAHQEIEGEKPRFTTFAEGSELEHDDLSSMRNYKQSASLEFRALISEGVEHLELVKA
jgi:hypothetical protein